MLAAPLLPIEATFVFEELQLTDFVRSLLAPSLYLPVAVNCWPSPAAIEGPEGVI